MINIISSSRYKINRERIKELVNNFFAEKNIDNKIYTINIVFIGRNKMKKIASDYKNEQTALPVLSFLYNEKQENNIFLGEIFICYPQMVLLAAERNKKVDEIINNLIIHGLKNLLETS